MRLTSLRAGREIETGKSPPSHRVADVVGWCGMLAIVTAYLLVSIEVLDGHSPVYQLMNLAGALALIWISWLRAVFQGVVINVFWVAIAIVGLLQLS
jgi:hypothetical protein